MLSKSNRLIVPVFMTMVAMQTRRRYIALIGLMVGVAELAALLLG